VWTKLRDYIVCPICRGDLDLHAIESRGEWCEAGLLLCESCRLCFPIYEGLPVLLPYATDLHARFRHSVLSGYSWPSEQPAPGEEFVRRSFSREWLEYDYDGVMWDLSYDDHRARLYAELGLSSIATGSTFLEVGCGLGMSTAYAQEALQGDAIGVDLSLASLSATRHFVNNPRLHFLQASVFALPFRERSIDVTYSHGVLHHTFSTRAAFLEMAKRCKGTAYVWLYGSGSLHGSPSRRIAWKMEQTFRPVIARQLDSRFAKAALSLLALPYFLGNAYHRIKDPTVQKYNFRRALHAARDRFTPLYADRVDFPEVASWFSSAGFGKIEQVDWRTMPTSNQENYKRNTGVRGLRGAVNQE
jgi:ubiquinone/menaquinone biosynthesis C-methylase UbiE/uncharacterized protein YbaR (Trm112 family)